MSDLIPGAPTVTGPGGQVEVSVVNGDPGLILGQTVLLGPSGVTETTAISGEPGMVIGAPVVLVAGPPGPPGPAPDTSTFYTRTETDNLLGGKANASTVGNLSNRVNIVEDRTSALEDHTAQLQTWQDVNDSRDLILLFENSLA